MLAAGAPLRHVVGSAVGYCSAGMVWQSAIWQLLEQLSSDRLRRAVLGHFLRLFGHARQHGSTWRVVDDAGFVGHQHEERDVVDEQTGEVRRKRCHVPARRGGRAGGMAAHERRSPRQLHRYRRALRGADRETPRGGSTSRGLMRSVQPPRDGSGAVVPRAEGSCWAYSQHWLLLPPSPEMLRRWGARPSSGAVRRPPPRLGSAELPRLPDEPAELRELLHELRDVDVPY